MFVLQGDDAPDDIHPAELSKQGLKRRSTFSLFVPRPSEEMKRFPKAYEALKDNFALAFEEIRDIVPSLPQFAECPKSDALIFIAANLGTQGIQHREDLCRVSTGR